MPQKFIKRLTRSKKFRYYTTRGKRISAAKYYAAIKKPSLAKIKKIKKQYVEGKDYFKQTRISFGDYGESYVVEKIINFYNSVAKRYSRGVRGVGYIQISGYLITSDGDRLFFQRATGRAFFKELKGQYLFDRVSELVRQIFSYLGESKYKADDFVMTKMSINVRKDK